MMMSSPLPIRKYQKKRGVAHLVPPYYSDTLCHRQAHGGNSILNAQQARDVLANLCDDCKRAVLIHEPVVFAWLVAWADTAVDGTVSIRGIEDANRDNVIEHYVQQQ